MKHLLLFFLFSGSLDSFSQVPDTTQPLRQFDAKGWSIKLPDTSVRILTMSDFYPRPGDTAYEAGVRGEDIANGNWCNKRL